MHAVCIPPVLDIPIRINVIHLDHLFGFAQGHDKKNVEVVRNVQGGTKFFTVDRTDDATAEALVHRTYKHRLAGDAGVHRELWCHVLVSQNDDIGAGPFPLFWA